MRRTAALLFVVAVACSQKQSPPVPTAPPDGALVAFRGRHVLAVELAVEERQWSRGLMGRRHLGSNAGMLFLFPKPQRLGFWMKGTLIPLSIAFLRRTEGQTYRVVRVLEMTPCKKDPCRVYDPKTSYDAALEANAGWFREHDVHVGSVGHIGR